MTLKYRSCVVLEPGHTLGVDPTLALVLADLPPAIYPGPARRGLDLLRGHWAIDRQIEPGGHFFGVPHFTSRSADSLLCRESGQLVLPDGTALAGENSYVYALRDQAIEIKFVDGASQGLRFIENAMPDDHADNVHIVSTDWHHCGPDTYDATFRIENHALFTVTYVVNGPAKAYVSRTVYRRIRPQCDRPRLKIGFNTVGDE